MNLFIYLKLREINYLFPIKPMVILNRPCTTENNWYYDHL